MLESELADASRDELIAYIRQLEAVGEQHQQVIAALQTRVHALEQKLAGRSGPGMPGTKPPRSGATKPAKPRKNRGHGFGRPRLPPTETVQHVLHQCPDCGTALAGG
jgi:hypothetical protein